MNETSQPHRLWWFGKPEKEPFTGMGKAKPLKEILP